MGLFTPPKSVYTNHFDQARFDLTWKLNAFMACVNLVLVATLYFFTKEEFLAAIYGWIVPVIFLVVLYRTRKFKTLSIIYVVTGTISTGLAMNFVEVKFHLVEVVFLVMISLYAYFTLGRKVGHATVATSAIFVIAYIVFSLNNDIAKTAQLSNLELISACFNFALAFSLIGYLVKQFVQLNSVAEDQYVLSNKRLGSINSIVKARDAEKTVMLKEIHHRVKNNLQVITSLLRLQSYETEDDQSKSLFEVSIKRIMAMSLIHEKMYQTDDLAALDLKEYLSSLSEDLIETYSINKPVIIEVDSEPINIADKYFVPMALLCNELITNSLKHAFIDENEGVIAVELNELPSGKFKFVYKDNGSWKNRADTNSFGAELIETLAEQLGSSVERTSDASGTTYVFEMDNLS